MSEITDSSSTKEDEKISRDVSEDDSFDIRLSSDGIKSFHCKFCNKSYSSKQLCKRHATAIHKKCDSSRTSGNIEQYHCQQCDMVFKSKHAFVAHEKTHSEDDNKQYRCETCSVILKTLASYKQHLNKHFGIKNEKNTLPCENCDAVFTSREGRRVHMILKHSAGQTYKCQECPMIFARKGNLRLHMTTHGIRPHVCSVCGKSYARIESLRTHEQGCANGKTGLFCEKCGQRFRKLELLEKHIQLGHPEKEHQCNYCGQSFESKRALSHHVRVHEGKFRCTHCSLQFVTEKALQNHEKSRHWEILGIERVIGKQGRRRDGTDRPKEPKARVRRNKYNPFLGLEHLAQLTEKMDHKSKSESDIQTQSAVLEDTHIRTSNYNIENTNFSMIDSDPIDKNSVHTVATIIEDANHDLEGNADNTGCERISNDNVVTDDIKETIIEKRTLLDEDTTLDCEQNMIENPAISVKEENEQLISDYEDVREFDGNNSESDGHENDWINEANEQDLITEIKIEHNPTVELSTKIPNAKIKAKRKARRKAKPVKKQSHPKKFNCDDCDKTFVHHYWLGVHREKRHGVRNEDDVLPKKNRVHICNQCDKSFSDWRNLLYHYKHVHKIAIQDSEVERCRSCKRRFINADELQLHSCFKGILVNRKPQYKCEICEKQYFSQHGLDCHRSSHPEYHKFNCDVCQKPFANIKDMNYHKKRVHVEACFTCDVCGKAFKVQAQLKIHVQIHQQSKGYQCEFCGKSFSQRNGMTAHLKIAHAEQLGEEAVAEREIICEICQKKLKGKICLKLHMKTHTDERNFECSYCDKKFIAKQDKMRHEQTHTKEYRFKCRFCGKGSTRRKLILLHEAKEHNFTCSEPLGPSHRCSICDRDFSSPSARQIHESLHSDDLPVPCKLCDRRFKNVKYMKYHLKAHHRLGNGSTSREQQVCDTSSTGIQSKDSTSLECEINNASGGKEGSMAVYSTFCLAQPHGNDIVVSKGG
ncbi:zinc finger protein 616-like [Malaya genurostris]|uniref:zinc finger protein 616-like n=1 Tax=Malaya genurostris TaxID=325434 RepID=UPI0026F3D755|nr:zinc finger protein 616-like [Malaya genurostris]